MDKVCRNKSLWYARKNSLRPESGDMSMWSDPSIFSRWVFDLAQVAFFQMSLPIGESDELDHLNPEQIDQGIRSKLTTHFRTKLTTLIRAN